MPLFLIYFLCGFSYITEHGLERQAFLMNDDNAIEPLMCWVQVRASLGEKG
jgi:hypothetical protein